MKIPKFAIAFTTCILLFGCTSQPPQTPSSPTPTPDDSPPTRVINPLKESIEELQTLQGKLKDGITTKAYSDIMNEIKLLVQRVGGEPKAVAAVKSAFAGHQLALQFWQCDRSVGYEELHQCRGKVLSGIFAKYPDMKAQAKAAVKSTNLSTISTQLDKDEVLQQIWERTSVDIQVARQAISTDTSPKNPNLNTN
ncbi:MAG TPA: hypothetical protein DCE56_08210 [Cyanobacteria bacterium UBA8553]|nr:hypothetical protein [Cyanobacteria bacterium UBA8553]HAJ58158.1 hypothetical protein [Cyanobacteria bacterium UBA8543]